MEEIFGEDPTVSITNVSESAAADDFSEADKSQEDEEVPAEKLCDGGKKQKRDCRKQGNKYDRLVAAVDSAREVEEKK